MSIRDYRSVAGQYEVFTLQNARQVSLTSPPSRVLVTGNQQNSPIVLISGTGQQRPFQNNEIRFLDDVISMIDQLRVPASSWRQILNRNEFRTMYQMANRSVNYIAANGNFTRMEETLPCMDCGIVVPRKLIQIDHQRPREGGQTEAILKTFRALRLTQEGPQGAKGQSMQFLGNVPTLNFTQVPTRPNRPAAAGQSQDQRYSLTGFGAILYSLIVGSGNLQDLERACLHGLFNLRPLCGSCNASRGNPLKYP